MNNLGDLAFTAEEVLAALRANKILWSDAVVFITSPGPIGSSCRELLAQELNRILAEKASPLLKELEALRAYKAKWEAELAKAPVISGRLATVSNGTESSEIFEANLDKPYCSHTARLVCIEKRVKK